MSHDVYVGNPPRMAMILLAIASTLIAIDLYIDFVEGVGIIHLLAEMFVFGVAIAGIVVLWRQLKQTRSDLAGALVEAEHWKNESRELIKGLGVAIEHQFERWKLSKAESEVGLLLLKGLSHKEIASLRETSERTVREQARSLYRKAGLAGRSSLAAFFLEDLLLPHGETGN
jgi:DNA-binding CsgD family transcriptional regulator